MVDKRQDNRLRRARKGCSCGCDSQPEVHSAIEDLGTVSSRRFHTVDRRGCRVLVPRQQLEAVTGAGLGLSAGVAHTGKFADRMDN